MLESACAEVNLFKVEIVRADTENTVVESMVSEFCKKVEEGMVRLNFALAGRNDAEK